MNPVEIVSFTAVLTVIGCSCMIYLGYAMGSGK